MGASGWQVVGYPDDPIPDDAGVVVAQTDHLRTVAANIASQVAALPGSGQVDALVWRSTDNDAPQQFRKQVSRLPHDLDLLRTRYVKVAATLESFLPVLQHTQAQARANLTIALGAYQDIQTAQGGIQQMNDFQYQAQQAAANQNQHLPAGQPPVQPATWTGPDYPAILTDAQTRFNNAKAQIDTAVGLFRSASETAADRVNAASNDGLKNQSPGFWGWVDDAIEYGTPIGAAVWLWDNRDAIGKEIDPILEDVAEISGTLSALAGLLAMVPIPGVDVIAGALAEGLGAVDALSDVVLLATGDDSTAVKEDLLMAAIGLASGGIARGLSKGADMVKDVRLAGDAVDAAEATRATKAADVDDAVKEFNSAQGLAGGAAKDAADAEVAADKASGTLYEGMMQDIATAQKVNADAAGKLAEDAMANLSGKMSELDQAQDVLAAKVEKLQSYNFSKFAKAIGEHVTGQDFVPTFKAEKESVPWINLSAWKFGSLGKLEVGLGTAASTLNVGSAAATLPGLHSTLEQIGGSS